MLNHLLVTISLPEGFSSCVTNVGVKDTTDDLTIVLADTDATSAGVFTQSRFVGPSVEISRAHNTGNVRGIVVVSKNANVANGPQGHADALEVVHSVAHKLQIAPEELFLASTGVIGRLYPMDKIRAGIGALPEQFDSRDAEKVAKGIMTTDTVHKIAEATVAGATARVVGVAKGVGMIEPDMATLIAMVFTDAAIDATALDATFRRVINRTMNCVSVDTDTSTSDTAICIASGKAGTVDLVAFEDALHAVLLSLTKQVARDGEGAETLIEVCVDTARDDEQAKTVAKAIVNSPLVKTAIHGADPNWGRVAMAIGKCHQYSDINQDNVIIRFGTQEVYPHQVNETGLDALSAYMKGDEVRIHVSLNTGGATATVWGCDLTDGYVRINADYTT